MVAYLVAVGTGGIALVARVYIGLYRTRIVRLRRLSRKRRFEAVPTDTPIDDSAGLARKRAVESINSQFSVTRLTFVPLVLLCTGIAMALPFIGQAPAALVSVFVTIITLVIGVAARPSLENAIAGLIISSSRLINLGDTVELDGHYGTVEDITATHTTIKLWDWRRYVVPNRQMMQSNFINLSLNDRHIWAAVDIWVDYQADLDRIRTVAVESAKESRHFTGAEEPEFWVLELGRDGVRCMVAAWTDLPSKAWSLKHDICAGIATVFQREGIKATVRHYRVAAESEPTLDQALPRSPFSTGYIASADPGVAEGDQDISVGS